MDLRAAAERFLESPSLSEGTRRAYRGDVGEFCDWLEKRRIALEQVDIRVLSDYVASLGERRTRKLAPATISRKLAAVRAFLRHALGPERVPDGRLAPRRPRRLPDAPTSAEIEQLLAALEGDGALAIRNRALVELVYSAGLRSAEAVGLDLGDVDFEQELVHVRQGKGGKDRVVPLGEEAQHWLARYLRDARPSSHRSEDGWTRRRQSRRRRPKFPPSAAGPSSSRPAGAASTPPPCAASRRTRTACGTRSPRTCSTAAPTSARSRSCSATAPSRRRRSTAMSTRATCAARTTPRTRAPRLTPCASRQKWTMRSAR